MRVPYGGAWLWVVKNCRIMLDDIDIDGINGKGQSREHVMHWGGWTGVEMGWVSPKVSLHGKGKVSST